LIPKVRGVAEERLEVAGDALEMGPAPKSRTALIDQSGGDG
jgi:hypothetical protein